MTDFQIRHTFIGIQGPEGAQGERGEEGIPGSMTGPGLATEDNIATYGADPTVLKDSGISILQLFPTDATLADLANIVASINTIDLVTDKLARDEGNRIWRKLGANANSPWRPQDDQSGVSDITPV